MSDYEIDFCVENEWQEMEFVAEVNAYVEDASFDHAFGTEKIVYPMWDEITSLKLVTKCTFTGINKYTNKSEYDIETVDIDFGKLRKSNRERIEEAVGEAFEDVTLKDIEDYNSPY